MMLMMMMGLMGRKADDVDADLFWLWYLVSNEYKDDQLLINYEKKIPGAGTQMKGKW